MRLRRSHARAAVAAVLAALLAWWCGPARSREMAIEERSVEVDGVQRTYLLHVPTNVANPAPVVMVFHGGGGRPEAMVRRTGMNELADRYGFIAVYPQGTPRPSGRGRTWNIGGGMSPSDADDVGFVRAILSQLERMQPIDRTRVYATGLSMGGILSYRLACEMSDTFAAIAPVSATMVEPSCRPSSPVAVLHIHGTDDDRIPISGGTGEMTASGRSWPAPAEAIASWSRLDACGASTKSDAGFANCTTYGQCRATVEYCVIAGGGHRWPEGAAEQIWAFFAAHPKPHN